MPFVPDNQLTPGQARHAELMTFLTAFRNEWSKTVADLNASLDTLASDIAAEIQQVRDAVAAAQAAIGDKAALEAALADAQGVLDSADQRVQAFSADLKADDPAPEPPADESA